jgi:hypothetical protein
MLTKLYRLMAPEGDQPSGGGGATPPSPPSPPATPAAPATGPAPTLDIAALAAQLAPALAGPVRDSIFAELRKSGVLKKDSPPAPDPAVAAAPTGNASLSAADVESMLGRRETFAYLLSQFEIPATALGRARQSFLAEKPDDVSSWVTGYATDMGWKQRNAQPPANGSGGSPPSSAPPATAPAQSTPSSSPPARVVTDDTRLIDMSEADIKAVVARLGYGKFKERVLAEMRTDQRRFKLR